MSYVKSLLYIEPPLSLFRMSDLTCRAVHTRQLQGLDLHEPAKCRHIYRPAVLSTYICTRFNGARDSGC
jgi:hypothetical protein